MATAGAQDILSIDSASFVVTEVIPENGDSVLESVAVARQDDVGASETLADPAELELEPSTSSTSAAAMMKTIIEALAAASKPGGAMEQKSEGEGTSGSEIPVVGQHPSESTATQIGTDETNSTAIAAAALQALASQMSSSSQLSSTEAIAQLQQVLNIPIEDIPAAATTLVNEVASEVIVMAQAAQHATMAAESLIEGFSGNEVEEDEDGEDEVPEEELAEEDEDEAELSTPRQTRKGKLKIHKCPECGKGYGLSTTLARHIQLHTKEKKCQHCDKIFFSPVKLSNHIRVHHTHAEKEKNSICQQCGKAFYNNAKLRVHMRSHTGDRPYKCSYCEKCFTCSSHRKRHERLHTGEHPYICPHCDKGFSSPSNLKDHIYVHTKENPYKCSECGKGFTQWGAMQRHVMAIHEKRKDVKCDECGKCFARKDYLKLHIQKCHWSKCDFCKESFEQPGELQQHLKVCTVPRTTPTKRGAPSNGKMYTTRSGGQIRTPPMRTPPRKRARTTPAIRRRKLTTPARIDRNLMSIYDQFEDDPLADPDYQDTEDEQQAPLEELVEEEGVQMDTEEVLEQEQVIQSIEELEEANNDEATDEVINEEDIVSDEGLDGCDDDTEACNNDTETCHDTDKSDGVHGKDDRNVPNDEVMPESAAVKGDHEMEREDENENKGNREEEKELQEHPSTGGTLESLMNALAAAAHCEEQQTQNKE